MKQGQMLCAKPLQSDPTEAILRALLIHPPLCHHIPPTRPPPSAPPITTPRRLAVRTLTGLEDTGRTRRAKAPARPVSGLLPPWKRITSVSCRLARIHHDPLCSPGLPLPLPVGHTDGRCTAGQCASSDRIPSAKSGFGRFARRNGRERIPSWTQGRSLHAMPSQKCAFPRPHSRSGQGTDAFDQRSNVLDRTRITTLALNASDTASNASTRPIVGAVSSEARRRTMSRGNGRPVRLNPKLCQRCGREARRHEEPLLP